MIRTAPDLRNIYTQRSGPTKPLPLTPPGRSIRAHFLTPSPLWSSSHRSHTVLIQLIRKLLLRSFLFKPLSFSAFLPVPCPRKSRSKWTMCQFREIHYSCGYLYTIERAASCGYGCNPNDSWCAYLPAQSVPEPCPRCYLNTPYPVLRERQQNLETSPVTRSTRSRSCHRRHSSHRRADRYPVVRREIYYIEI